MSPWITTRLCARLRSAIRYASLPCLPPLAVTSTLHGTGLLMQPIDNAPLVGPICVYWSPDGFGLCAAPFAYSAWMLAVFQRKVIYTGDWRREHCAFHRAPSPPGRIRTARFKDRVMDVSPKYTSKGIHPSIPSSQPNTVQLSTLLLQRLDVASSSPEHVVIYFRGIYLSFLISSRVWVYTRQRRKPTPPPRLRHSAECRPITDHPRARPAFILDIPRSPSYPSRPHRQLRRGARLCRFAIPDIAPDDLRPLPRCIHRALPAGIIITIIPPQV